MLKKILMGFLVLIGMTVVCLIGFFAFFMITLQTTDFQTVPSGKINPNIYAIETGIANFYLIKNGKTIICIDAGNKAKSVEKDLKNWGIDPGDIKAVFLTHTDNDHVGNLSLFKNAKIYLSEDEEQMINGKTSRFGMIKNQALKREYTLVSDSEKIRIGSLTIQGIKAPGHTPGSMMYLVEKDYLFVGDCLNLKNNKVVPFFKKFTMDMETMKKSIEKAARLKNVKMIFTGHTGYTNDFNKAMEKWK
ncbi:MAG: MBL fold metallo-hydrolase [Spirochaetes bacterium]|nr:MBL fold metallo-hydrolase [Spirochaetota bacterium]